MSNENSDPLLSEGVGELQLTELNMQDCDNLNHEEALEIIIKIDTLTSLDLTNWKMSSLPEGFGGLKSLQTLHLTRCFKLGSLPAGCMYTTNHHIYN